MTYQLSPADQQDLCKRLADCNISMGGAAEPPNYLTPCSLRYSRTKSMLATTKTTKSSDGDALSVNSPYPAGHTHETEGDGPVQTTISAYNSGGRGNKKPLSIPQQFTNCAKCGSIIFNVSALFCKAESLMRSVR